MIYIVTYQDLLDVGENEQNRMDFVRGVINSYKGSEGYKMAVIADEYDSLGDVPGWEVSRAMRSYPNENMRNVLVSMSADKNFVGIKTYDRQHGTRGRFLISRTAISTLLDAPKGTVRYESDCGDYAMITRLEDKLQFSFAWLNYSGDGDIKGFRQDITIPLSKLRLVLDWSESVKYLYTPTSPKAYRNALPGWRIQLLLYHGERFPEEWWPYPSRK